MNKKDVLKNLLERVSDTYADFVHGVLRCADTDEKISGLIDFMTENPRADSSEVSICLERLEGRLN